MLNNNKCMEIVYVSHPITVLTEYEQLNPAFTVSHM